MKYRCVATDFEALVLRMHVAALLAVVCLLSIAGCSQGPTPVHVPEVDAEQAAQSAMELYDKDHDGALNEAELAACPGILGHLSLYDADKNGSVSQEEIEKQITELRASRVGLTMLSVQLRLDGRPLKGAHIKLIPEKYLGDEVKGASGTTNARGIATMDIRDVDLPVSDHGLLGVHYGTFKLEVTHPTVSIPAKYNTETTLGYETEKGNPNLNLDLKSR